jgi:hypothetical protein
MHSGTPSKRWKGTDMKKIRKSIAEIKDEIYDTLGGIAGAVKYYKRHPSAFYPDYFKTPPSPLITNNVNVANVRLGDESARRQLELAFLRLIEARKNSIGDPAVFVDGKRMRDDGSLIDHQPRLSDDPRPATDDAAVSPLDENLKSPMKGPLLKPGGVATTLGAASPSGGQNKISKYSNLTVPGLAAGAALDQSADTNLSASEKSLLCFGGGRRWP